MTHARGIAILNEYVQPGRASFTREPVISEYSFVGINQLQMLGGDLAYGQDQLFSADELDLVRSQFEGDSVRVFLRS